jgi:diacylglycerol kinase family enzyme
MQLAQASQHDLGIISLPASTWTPHAMMDHVDGEIYAEAARRLEIEILPQQLRVVCESANGSLYQWTQ